MKCFEHQEVESIGICNYCGKGLCQDCFTFIDDNRLSCKGNCEEKLKSIFSLEEKSKKSFSSANKNLYFAPLLNLVMGILFTYYGYTEMNKTLFFLFMGVAFLIYGSIGMYRDYNYWCSINKSSD